MGPGWQALLCDSEHPFVPAAGLPAPSLLGDAVRRASCRRFLGEQRGPPAALLPPQLQPGVPRALRLSGGAPLTCGRKPELGRRRQPSIYFEIGSQKKGGGEIRCETQL